MAKLPDNFTDLEFVSRHLGPRVPHLKLMLETVGLKTLNELIESSTPDSIQADFEMDLPKPLSEQELLERALELAHQNKVNKSFIGLGYYDCITPPVILRNILENPGWYTAYTPYQAEISQGRMEALLNFQTMVTDLTGLEIANASLLDEGTAAAEAMTLCRSINRKVKANAIFVDESIFPQTLEVLHTRALPLGIEIITGKASEFDFSKEVYAAFVQYPNANGEAFDHQKFFETCHNKNILTVTIADLLSLTLLKPPGEMGADVVVGNTQRFGVPMGFGGPHAAYMATKESYKRSLPGRIIGMSKDQHNNPALRLALQTREQHIRREKATSNICTAQVLLAVIASSYAVYHGPQGLKRIAQKVHRLTGAFANSLRSAGIEVQNENFFDTVTINTSDAEKIYKSALSQGMNLQLVDSKTLRLAFDESKTEGDVNTLVKLFTGKDMDDKNWPGMSDYSFDSSMVRTSEYLTHPTFNLYRSETELLRYLKKLENKDLTLAHAMIPLGSCTMKLNATAEMIPVTWPEFGKIHPFAPLDQAKGYLQLIQELEKWLCEITGFAACSLQPNAGSQGEYAGLLVIRQYHLSRGDNDRNICLIPSSAHGTNPASAVMAGMKVVVVKCDDEGNIDMVDLKSKSEAHKENLAALMVTYPSTHGVFEDTIKEICEVIHNNGGQVYMDGANFNALIGVTRPGHWGADVSHLNLHKTFCIPHGGGGPGVGPIGVAEHLAEFLPKHSLTPECGPKSGISAVSSAPWGSASILPISWAYMAMMGSYGLSIATRVAILNANYIARKLEPHFNVLYKGKDGWVAHECIIDTRPFKDSAGVSVDDIAKRLMDFGFHAPTMSWPVAGTLMIEPTESESKEELDRFCEAMIQIRKEIQNIEEGKVDKEDNVLKHAPHSIYQLTQTEWNHSYSREAAAFPLPWVKNHKFWVPVSRVDNAYGDRNLVCSCPPLEDYES